MYKQPGQEEFLFYILYTGAAVLSLISCCYLLFRRGNAFAPDIKSSARLRRWTAALFASTTLSHAWYLPGVFLTSDDDIMLHDLVGGLLDSITVIPLSIVVMFCMLQDRKRPLWPATPSSAGCTIRRPSSTPCCRRSLRPRMWWKSLAILLSQRHRANATNSLKRTFVSGSRRESSENLPRPFDL